MPEANATSMDGDGAPAMKGASATDEQQLSPLNRPRPQRVLSCVGAAVLIGAIAFFFGITTEFDYTNWDDPLFVEHNPHLQQADAASLRALWTPGAVSGEALYVPLTYTSYWLDRKRGLRMEPGPVHATNVVLHALAAVLVLALLRRLRIAALPAFAGAFLFAMHPLQAEAVAWVMGRKDLLSAVFGLGCLVLLARARVGVAASIGAIALGAAALLSKPSLVVLPVLGLLIEATVRGGPRALGRAAWLRAGALAVLALGALVLNAQSRAAVEASYSELSTVYALDTERQFGRLVHLPELVLGWCERLFLVRTPAVLYEYPEAVNGSRTALGAVLIIAIVAAGVLALRRRSANVLAGLGFTAVAFAPAAALVLEGPDARPFLTADRFGYLPLVGLALLYAACAAALPTLKGHKPGWTLALLLWVSLPHLAQPQIAKWRDGEHLWRYETERQPRKAHGYVNLGQNYFQNGEQSRAMTLYQRAVNVDPDDGRAQRYLGVARSANDQPARAERAFGEALRIDPDDIEAQLGLGAALATQGKIGPAMRAWKRVVELAPTHSEAHFNLALIYRKRKENERALEHFRAALPGIPIDVRVLTDEAVLESLRQRMPVPLGG